MAAAVVAGFMVMASRAARIAGAVQIIGKLRCRLAVVMARLGAVERAGVVVLVIGAVGGAIMMMRRVRAGGIAAAHAGDKGRGEGRGIGCAL